MMRPALAIILVLLCVVVAVYAAATWRVATYVAAHYNDPPYPRALYSECAPHLKTGDLVFFVRHHHLPHTSILINHLFTHCGVVFRHKGRLYVAETGTPRGPTQTHAHRDRFDSGWVPSASSRELDLRERLVGYPGTVHVARLQKPLSPAQEAAVKVLVDISSPFPKPRDFAAAMLLGGGPANEDSRHCAGRAMEIIDAAGLTPTRLAREGKTLRGAAPYLRAMHALVAVVGVPLGPDGANRYGPIHQLVPDVGTVRPGDMV